jgi:aminoglycoside phosphotransferase (APT) family kinase protein
MRPLTDDQILRRARASLRHLRNALSDAGQLTELAAVDAALSELMVRRDAAFISRHFERGFALVKEGARLAGSPSIAEACSALPNVGTTRGECVRFDDLAPLAACLQSIVAALGRATGEDQRDYLDRVTVWDCELATTRAMTCHRFQAPQVDHRFTASNLEQYLRQKLPQRKNLRVTDFKVLSGGYSKLTILFEATDDVHGTEAMVIRANSSRPTITVDGADIRNEFHTLSLAFRAGLTLPEPLWLETDESLFGVRFAVSRKASGKSIGSGHTSEVFEAITPQIKSNIVGTLLSIHSAPIDAASDAVARTHLSQWTRHKDVRAMALASVDYWMSEIGRHGAVITPKLQRLYDWLINNPPAPESMHPVFLHGDYGLHNLLMEGDKVSAVLDWEMAKFGDPAEDFVALFITMNVESDDDILRAYVEGGGHPVSAFRLYYYRLLTMLRVWIFDAIALQQLAAEGDASINLFNWLAGPSHILTHNVNDIIRRAESLRERSA